MVSIGIFTTDKDLNIMTWDAWLEQITGIPQSKAKGQSLSDLFPDIENRNLIKRFQNVLKDGVVEILSPVFHHYLIPCNPPFQSRYFDRMQQRVTIAPLKEHENILGTIVTIEDMTEKLEREKGYSEKLRSPNESERISAVQELTKDGRVEQRDVLKEALKDESWRVRKVVVDGLKKQTDRETVGSLLIALKEEHHNINVLNSAIQILTMSEMNVTDTLIDFLKSSDNELRQYAALSLGEIADASSIPALIEALSDEDMNVRFHAIEALGKMKAHEAVDALIRIVETKDFFLAFPALDALVGIGDRRVSARLIPLLDDDMLMEPAADALGVLGDEYVVPHLVALINRDDTNVMTAIKAIVAIYENYIYSYGDGTVISDIVKGSINKAGAGRILHVLDRAEDSELNSIIVILGWLEGDEIDRALTRLLGKTTARKEIIDAIVRHGQQIVELLIEQLGSEDIEIRKSSVIALGRIGDKRAVQPLVNVLKQDMELAVIAAGALAKIGDRSVFEALIELIGNRDVAIRQAVISALNSIGHPDMEKRMVELLKDGDPIVRESAVKIAGYFGYRECIDLLIERCSDEAENVRYAAVQCLPYLDDDRVVKILLERLEKDKPRVRSAAAYALGQIEDKSIIPYLQAALQDADPWVRYFATKSVGESGNPEMLDTLGIMAQEDTANQVRIAAIDAIGKIGGDRAVSILAKFIESDNFDISRTVINALGKIDNHDAQALLLSKAHSHDAAVRSEAIRALGNRGGVEVVNTLKWIAVSDPREDIAQEAAESLCNIGSRDAISALIDLTSHESRRAFCIARLSQFIGRYIEWVADGLKHINPTIRRAMVDVLARMKHPDATEALTEALDDKDTSVRLAAVNALGYLGTRFADRKLAKVARFDPDEAVRIAAEKVIKIRS